LHTTIANTRTILQLIETFEDSRDLSLEEWNFREILKEHLTLLLRQQKIYWRQRGSIKWVKMGDAGTKFFHSNATIKYRKSLITELQSAEGSIVTEHKEKEKIIWEEFKERLGVMEFTDFQINPALLIQRSTELRSLELPFQQWEIDGII
jgi:hypothetical protein